MLFKKRNKNSSPAPYRGTQAVLEGYEAILQVEKLASEVLVTLPYAAWNREIENGQIRVARKPEVLAGMLEGLSGSGLRAAGFIDGADLERIATRFAKPGMRRFPVVIHHLLRAVDGKIATDVLSRSGVVLLRSATVQEAVDFALIAHKIAETSLAPVICLHDSGSIGSSLQQVQLPTDELIDVFLGTSDDEIESHNGVQEILFGAGRRRIPEWIDVDRPLGLGLIREPHVEHLSRVADASFFQDSIASIVDEAFLRFGELTGRKYARAQEFQVTDADYVVIVEGVVEESLRQTVDYLREKEKIRAGLIRITTNHPFPGSQVSKLLRGRKGVTVLTDTVHPVDEESELYGNIRSSILRAEENGLAEVSGEVYADYETYKKPSDRPPLYEVFVKRGSIPSFSELVAVYKNMQGGSPERRHAFLGDPFRSETRLPEVERIQQRIHKINPDLSRRVLMPVRSAGSKDASAGIFAIAGGVNDQVSAVGNAFARAFLAVTGGNVSTYVDGFRPDGGQSTTVITAHTQESGSLPAVALPWNAAITSSPLFWNCADRLGEGGLLVTHWNPDQFRSHKGALVRSLSILREKKVRVFCVDTVEIVSGIDTGSSFISFLRLAALLGAFIEEYPKLEDEQKARLKELWIAQACNVGAEERSRIETLRLAIEQGGEKVSELSLLDLVEEVSTQPEPDAPWTVRAESETDHSLYDLTRFWGTSGYLYEHESPKQLLADPVLATDTVPARTSAVHSNAPYREHLPVLVAEKCTACGKCWVSCPESALPVTIQSFSSLLETAFDRCKASGHSLIQLQRILKHLGPQAHRLFAQDDGNYTTAGMLFQDAFEALLERMKPGTEQRTTLENEFAVLLSVISDFPLVKTDTFFNLPEQDKEGTGLVFSLVVNSDACKACNLCVEACPERALEMQQQNGILLDHAGKNWDFMQELPDVSTDKISTFIDEKNAATSAYHFLNRQTYHTVVGGDLSAPGTTSKIAVHLLTGFVEADLRPRIEKFTGDITELMVRIEKKVDTKLHETVQVKDLAALGEQLTALKASSLNLEELAPLLHQADEKGIDREWLLQLTEAYRQLSELKRAYTRGAHGDGRARMAMGIVDGKATTWARTFPYNPFPFPWFSFASEEGPGLAEGLWEGIIQKMADTFTIVRKAKLYLEGKYKPDEHDPFFDRFNWDDFTDEERALCPPVLLVVDNADAVPPIVELQFPVKVLVLSDSSSLIEKQNAGTFIKSPALPIVAYQDVYVMQSSVGFPEHLMAGFQEGLQYPGTAVFYVYVPAHEPNGLPVTRVLDQAKLAVQGRVFPVFRFDPGKDGYFFDRIDLTINPNPEDDWAQPEGVGAGGEGYPLTFAEWAVHEPYYRRHFRLLEEDKEVEAVHLSAYLDMDENQRTGVVPFVVRGGAVPARMHVSQEMVSLAENHRVQWQLIQRLPARLPSVSENEAEASSIPPDAIKYHAVLTQKLLELSGFAPRLRNKSGSDEGASIHFEEKQLS